MLIKCLKKRFILCWLVAVSLLENACVLVAMVCYFNLCASLCIKSSDFFSIATLTFSTFVLQPYALWCMLIPQHCLQEHNLRFATST